MTNGSRTYPGFSASFRITRSHGLVGQVEERSTVLPVGVDLRRLDRAVAARGTVPRITWNQRWEYDKGTEELARALLALERRGVDFEVSHRRAAFSDRPG